MLIDEKRRAVLCLVSGLLFSVSLNGAVFAQADSTILTVEIMAPSIGGDRLAPQRWQQVFRDIGEGVRIRQALPGDKPEVSETKRGPLRMVKIVGALDRNGILVFPKHEFKLQQADQLAKWIEELKQYGAQGAPDGQPLWGLSEAQFKELMQVLAVKNRQATKGVTLANALQQLPIPESTPVEYHSTAELILDATQGHPLQVEVNDVSVGTALASILSQSGLGFQPYRQPDGRIHLLVQPLKNIKDPWPVGFDIDEKTPRNQVLPKLFEMVNAGFDSITLRDVFEVVTEQTAVPIIVDYSGCVARGVDPATHRVSYPRKKTAYALVLRSVVRGSTLNYKFRQDESGTPFIYIYPFVPFTPE